MGVREDVELKKLDGLVLRGFLYPAKAKGPGIVMTPGLPEDRHYGAGLRSEVRGRSDGMPRSDINPAKQAEDFSDAITFLKTKPVVDPKRIAFWGYSMSAAAVLVAAGLDPRVKLVVAKYLDLAIRDREAQARGREPFYVPYIGDSEEDALFDYRKQRDMGELEYDQVMENLSKLFPGFRNEVTVQTLSRLAAWSFKDVPRHVGATPVLQVYAIHEELEHIKKTQEDIWAGLTGPKERHYENSGHMDILTPDGHRFVQLVKIQVDFVLKYLGEGMR
ncbi:hypothetical protein DL771_009990 [Monosporascus sp. 5C6A]|nr:hypothetical protein DL771_009990 [Monosporascus sp. 5C6A]